MLFQSQTAWDLGIRPWIMNPCFHPPSTHIHVHTHIHTHTYSPHTYTYTHSHSHIHTLTLTYTHSHSHSEISRNDDQLTELKMYKKFLDSLAPQVSSDQHHANQQTQQLLTSPLLPHKPLSSIPHTQEWRDAKLHAKVSTLHQ